MGKTCLFFIPVPKLPDRLAFFFASWDGGAAEANAIGRGFLEYVAVLCSRDGSDFICVEPATRPEISAVFAAHPRVLAAGVAMLELFYAQSIGAGEFEIHSAALPDKVLRVARAKMRGMHIVDQQQPTSGRRT